jgi:hypothetical protein
MASLRARTAVEVVNPAHVVANSAQNRVEEAARQQLDLVGAEVKALDILTLANVPRLRDRAVAPVHPDGVASRRRHCGIGPTENECEV